MVHPTEFRGVGHFASLFAVFAVGQSPPVILKSWLRDIAQDHYSAQDMKESGKYCLTQPQLIAMQIAFSSFIY